MTENTLDDKTLDMVKDVAKEVAKEVYDDAGKPIMKPTGELLGLVPRAIKAALAPVEKWVLQKEYNVAETKKLLEEKLSAVSPELIESPEPHIAVPALQYISYCMDNEELRDMYANLLANSMNKVVKDGVHPGFVEIIKQLSPDEAKFLKYMRSYKRIPIITLSYVKKDGGGIQIIKDFTNVLRSIGCEKPLDSRKYIDNLVRLGLLERSPALASLTDKTKYDPLKTDPHVLAYNKEDMAKKYGFDKCSFSEGYVDLTAYGESFCDICLGVVNVINII